MSQARILSYILSNMLLLLLVALPVLLLFLIGVPYHRGFFCEDETIRHPYLDSTISTGWLYVAAFGVPFIAVIACELWVGRGARNRGRLPEALQVGKVTFSPVIVSMCQLYVSYLLGAAFSQTATDTTKYTIGRLRPHFIDVCNPDWTNITCRDEHGPLFVTNFTCLGNEVLFSDVEERESKIKDARLSFVSGHASFSFQVTDLLPPLLCLYRKLNLCI